MIPNKISALLSPRKKKWLKKDIAKLTSYFSNLNDDVTCEEWAKAILRTIVILKQQDTENNEIIKFITSAKTAYIDNSPRSYKYICSIIKEECKLYISAGYMQKALQCANEYLYWVIGQAKKTATNDIMGYYSFRTFSNYSLADITNETISLAHPSVFNDPLDTVFLFSLDNYIQNLNSLAKEEQEFKLLLRKATNHIKLRCFVGNKQESSDGYSQKTISDMPNLMWAHYANGHRGFCVEYFFDKAFFSQNDKDSQILIHKMEYRNQLKIDGSLSIKRMLLQKAADWEYENEMRLLYFSPNETKAFPTIKCPNCIKAIYLGTKCSEANILDMKEAIGDKNIPLYQMTINKNNIIRLEPIRIG